MAELENKGTSADDWDLPATGSSVALVKTFPGFQPGDYAYTYIGDIDVSTIGDAPRSDARLRTSYPYLWDEDDIKTGVGQIVDNNGTEGSSADIASESTVSFNSIRNISFPALTNNYLSVPDEAALDITTSISITFRFCPAEPDNRLGNQRIIAKSGTARGYEVFLGFDSAHATLGFTRDGTTLAVASEKVPFLPEHFYWVRVTYDSGTGSTNFYWAPDATSEPSSWNQLGATQTNVTGAIVANTDTLKIGAYTTSGSGDLFKGRIVNVIIRNAATAGSVVLNIDVPTDCAAMVTDTTTTFTATSGQTVTLTKSGTPPSTVRVQHPGTWSTPAGGIYSRHAIGGLDQLASEPNTMHLIWVKVNVLTGVISSSRRMIYPIIRAYDNVGGASYGPHSWGLYFDVFQFRVHWTMQSDGTDNSTEVFVQNNGISVSTGVQVYGVALWEQDGSTFSKLFRYTPATNSYTFSTTSPSAPQPASLPADDLIGNAADLELWAGLSGFLPLSAGIARIPNFVITEDSVGWASGEDVNLRTVIEPHLRTVAGGLDPQYTVGEYWRASTDGTSEIASSGIEEGDVLAVRSTAPTWQHIQINHPSRRKTLFRPRSTTFGYTTDPVEVLDTEDFFIWAVVANDGVEPADEYVTYSYHTTGDSWMDLEAYISGGDWNVFMEIDDDDGNAAWIELDQSVDESPTLWARGHSDPTLMAMGIDRSSGSTFRGWMYDATNGYRELTPDEDSDPLTGSLTFDQFDFLGPDLGEGYNDSIIWAGGWNIGVGVIPSPDEIVDIWRKAVYGA